MSNQENKKTSSNHFARGQGTKGLQTPVPQIRNGEKYYSTNDVAKIIGVTQQTVSYWQQKGLFTADERAHDGRYLYEVGRVEQLKSVYRPDWNQQPVLRKDEPETFGDFMDGVFGDISGDKSAKKTPATKTKTFVDLQDLVNGVLGSAAQDILPTTEQKSEPTATEKSNPEAAVGTPTAATTDKKDANYRKKISEIYLESVRRIEELPLGDRRGLEPETFLRLRIGFLPKCRHPKYPNSSPSPRFIVRLGDNNDPPSINAILTPSGRKRFTNKKDKASEKTLTMGDKLLFYPDALEGTTFFVTEGEINAASIMQATKWNVRACALGGAGIFGDLKRRLAALPSERREQLKIFILFDKDAESKTGQKNALKLQKILADMGIAGLPVFVDDFLSPKQKETFAGAKNIDPNDILCGFPYPALSLLIDKIRDNTEADFSRLKEEIRQLNLFKREQDRQPTAKKSSSEPTAKKDTADYDSFRAHIMLDTIDPAALDYSEWLSVISACKNIDVEYSVVDAFNRRDPKRYDASGNQTSWNSVNDSSFNIRTLHGIAKRFGYTEADARRQWYEIHPELKPSKRLRNIAEETQRELDDAVIWLETLSEENFSADDAYNPDNIRAVALAQTYGFAAVAEKFFAVIKTSKALAQTRIKEADTGFIAPLDTDELARLGAFANLHLETLRKNIAREVQTLARAQKDFAKQQAEEQSRQKAIKARSEHQARVEENIKTLIELRAEYQKNPSPELAKKMRAIIFNSCDVTTDRYTGEVKAVKATAANADLIFTFDPNIDGAIGYDEFQQADVILKRPPWRHDDCINAEWTDRDDDELKTYLRRYYTEFASENLISSWTTSYSNKHAFHPVKDYFNNLPKWDGKPRAEKLFIKFLRVDDTPFAREVTMNWLTAAVARIFHPGCRYQTALVLHGNQKIGKSYIIERIGGKWYSEIIDNVDDPHAIDAIRNTWIGEFKEMAGMRKAELNAIKSFIERAADNRRTAYEKRAARILRHCIFAITVNDDHFLIDMTGNRRYLILHCNSPKFSYVTGLTDEYISQVWAEVYQHYNELFKDGFDEKKLELSADAQIQGEEIASNYLRDDGLTGEIQAFLNMKIPPAVIWDLLSKEERNKFIANAGQLHIYGGQEDLITRRENRGGRSKAADIQKINEFFSSQNERKLYRKVADNQIILYGTEYRQHICAAEIFNECFENDKRSSMPRIHEILSALTDWSVGKGTPRDPVYGNQRKVFYRNNEIPAEPPTDDEPTAPPTHDDNGNHGDGGAPRELNPATETQSKNFNNGRQQDSHEQNDFWEVTLDLEDPPF